MDIAINKADATIVVDGYTGVYDAAAHGATLVSATGVGGADLSASVTMGGETFTEVPGGKASWTFSNNNYNDQSATDVDIAINKADATIVVTPYSVTYDAAAHTATGSAKGVENEDLAGLDLSGTIHTGVGDYTGDTWTFTDATGNYNNANGTVDNSISQAELSITANYDEKTYDGSVYNGGNGVTYSGFVNGETEAVLSGTLTYSGSSQGAINVGDYSIMPAGLTSDNYTITFNTGTLSIAAKPLDITADDTVKAYGAEDPEFTVSYAGFVSGEDEMDLGGSLVVQRATGEMPGNYMITPSGLTSGNYAITFKTGLLTITPPGEVVLKMASNGRNITGTGDANVVYTIQAKSDMAADWDNIGTATADENGAFQYEDTDAGNYGMRLYRVVIPMP